MDNEELRQEELKQENCSFFSSQARFKYVCNFSLSFIFAQ